MEQGKKFSYELPPDLLSSETHTCITVPKPASILLQVLHCDGYNKAEAFVFAGLEIISNSRNIEAYEIGVVEGKDVPSYLSTQRGALCECDAVGVGGAIALHKSSDKKCMPAEFYKAVITNPQGPTEVYGVLLKLLSLKPTSSKNAQITKLLVKCRLKDIQSQNNTPVSNENKLHTKSLSEPQTHASTSTSMFEVKDNIGDALAVVSMLARTTENKVIEAIENKFKDLDDSINLMKGQLVHQTNMIAEQSRLLVEQQKKINNRDQVVISLLEKQSQMMNEFNLKIDSTCISGNIGTDKGHTIITKSSIDKCEVQPYLDNEIQNEDSQHFS